MSAFVLGVDTNVLVRFLTADDPEQSPLTLLLVEDKANQPIFVGVVVMVELVWVLTKVKKRPRPLVFEACRDLLTDRRFRIENPSMLARALDDAERVGCDLADAVIALSNEKSGCETTLTFDLDAQDLPGMTALEARA